MDAMYEESALELQSSDLFTLPGMLLDQSAAIAAAERMYSNHRAGVRFYSDFRRVISVSEMMALSQVEEACEEPLDDQEISHA